MSQHKTIKKKHKIKKSKRPLLHHVIESFNELKEQIRCRDDVNNKRKQLRGK